MHSSSNFSSRKIMFIAACMSVSACLQIFREHFIYWSSEIYWMNFGAYGQGTGCMWAGFIIYSICSRLPVYLLFFRCQSLAFCGIFAGTYRQLISLSFYYFFADIEAYAGLSGCCMVLMWR